MEIAIDVSVMEVKLWRILWKKPRVQAKRRIAVFTTFVVAVGTAVYFEL